MIKPPNDTMIPSLRRNLSVSLSDGLATSNPHLLSLAGCRTMTPAPINILSTRRQEVSLWCPTCEESPQPRMPISSMSSCRELKPDSITTVSSSLSTLPARTKSRKLGTGQSSHRSVDRMASMRAWTWAWCAASIASGVLSLGVTVLAGPSRNCARRSLRRVLVLRVAGWDAYLWAIFGGEDLVGAGRSNQLC